LHTQIDALTGLTTDKATLKTGVDAFYDIMPKNDDNKKEEIKILQESGKTYMQTYDQKTEIDLDKKLLKGFSDDTEKEYVFATYRDLLASANLTNRLKDVFADNVPVSAEPFHVDDVTGNIEFDDAKWYELRATETTAISGGWFTSRLKGVAQILEDDKEDYCKYLNGLKFRKTTE
jgi:hypothetical protein